MLIPTSMAQTNKFILPQEELQQKLMTRFTFIFFSELDRAGAYISYDSWQIIGNVLNHGAVNLASSSPTPQTIKQAERDLVRIAKAAITFGRKLPSGEIRLGEGTWDKVKVAYCPLWPFC